MRDIDVERVYAARSTAGNLRRIAEALEEGRPFRIQIAGRRIRAPADARLEIEVRREEKGGEIEIEWKRRGQL